MLKKLSFIFLIFYSNFSTINSIVYKVNTDSSPLTVRTGPSTSYSKCGSLPKGSVFYSKGSSNGWAQLYNGHVSGSYLKEAPVLNKVVISGSNSVNIREGPGTNHKIITSLSKGTELEYYGRDPTNNDWGVTNKGYIFQNYFTDLPVISNTNNNENNIINNINSNNGDLIDLENDDKLRNITMQLLKAEEGSNKEGICIPYEDTEHFPTIGIGHLCKKETVKSKEHLEKMCQSSKEICKKKEKKGSNKTYKEGEILFLQDIEETINGMNTKDNIKKAWKACDTYYRKAVMVSMAFQNGPGKFSNFSKTLNHIANQDWKNAAKEMKASAWYKQTTNRAVRQIVAMYLGNCDYITKGNLRAICVEFDFPLIGKDKNGKKTDLVKTEYPYCEKYGWE